MSEPQDTPSEEGTPADTAALSTHDLLQVMLSMQQTTHTFQVSMAEERAAEKKAREAREMQDLAMREKMLIGNRAEKARQQAIEVAAAQQRNFEEQQVAQTQMKAGQERLLKEQKEAKAKHQKENEKARKKEERLKAIPNLPAMTKATKLIEYLSLFETTQVRKEREWSIHLLPLLNDKLRVGAMNLSRDERDNYQTLKAKLIESEENNLKNSAQRRECLSGTMGTNCIVS